jgi:hypothetical protein
MDWLSAAMTLLNKAIPERKEDAVNAIHQLEELHGRALANLRLILAAQIKKRIRQIKETYKDM